MNYNQCNEPFNNLIESYSGSNILEKLNNFMLDYLTRLSVDEIKQRILWFENLDVLSLTDDQLKEAFLKVMSANFEGALVAPSIKFTDKIEKGSLFFRARKLDVSKCNSAKQQYFELHSVLDFGPPPNGSRMGRLNVDGERLLYTVSGDLGAVSAVLKEARIRIGDYFALAVFENIEVLEFFNIARSVYPTSSNDATNKIKMRLVSDFIGRLFFKKSGESFERIYKVSNVILKNYFNIVGDTVCGWIYPSTRSFANMNACFLPSATEKKLKVSRAFVCRLYEEESVEKVNIESYCQIGKDGKLNFLCNWIPPHRDLLSGMEHFITEVKTIYPT